MKQYIDKDTLVAEIERRFQKYWKRGEESDALQDGNAKYWGGVLSCLNEVKTLINTIEVKEVQEEPVNIDFEQELYKAFGQVKDFTLGIRIAKWFYDIGKNSHEPVSKGLEEAAFDYAESCKYEGGEKLLCVEHFKAGAEWQKKKDLKEK